MPETALNLMMPGHPRYQPKDLRAFFGYDNLYRGLARVEIESMRTLAEIGIIPAEEIALLTDELVDELMAIPTTTVDRIEREVTKHDVRAWVQEAQRRLNSRLGRWVHVTLTSYDPLDTGRVLQFLEVYEKVTRPSIRQVVELMVPMVRRFADQIQIGRTHGQAALPITVGFWLATILSRILHNAQEIEEHSRKLVGKISGAVGAYNAQVGLRILGRCGGQSFEERVLAKLGLKPARISTQILPPEPLAYFLFASLMLSAAFGQFGRDCRNLMRSEIAEVAEAFDQEQVGSSTMVHKRNPMTFEGLEGAWIRTKNEFGKVLDTMISEHQRDLVGSSVARDFPIIIINLQQQMDTLLRADPKTGIPFISRITVDPEACRLNFERQAHLILAEPLYIALQMYGYLGDAHRLLNRQVVPVAQKEGVLLIEVLRRIAEQDREVAAVLTNIPPEIIELFYHPEQYTGLASRKANEIAEFALAQVATY